MLSRMYSLRVVSSHSNPKGNLLEMATAFPSVIVNFICGRPFASLHTNLVPLPTKAAYMFSIHTYKLHQLLMVSYL